MAKLEISVSAKDMTSDDCVRLKTYEYYDSIVKAKDYQGETQINITLKNNCDKIVTVPSFQLFENTENGGNFTATVNTFVIQALQTVSVPLLYNGMYLGDEALLNYMVELNGVSCAFIINVTEENQSKPKPIISDISLECDNRDNTMISIETFTNGYSEDNKNIDCVYLYGDIENVLFNNSAYIEGTAIPVSMISQGALFFIPSNTDNSSKTYISWSAQDVDGTMSDTASLTVSVKGVRNITLTRTYYYNTNNFSPYVDDVKFSDNSNPFSDMLFQSNCMNWTEDKIKIIALPHKGLLYYIQNPNNPLPIYAPVTIGQEIVVRDIIDNKVLKFSGEGNSNNENTDSYLTSFSFIRKCGQTESDTIVNVGLNMIVSRANAILKLNVLKTTEVGETEYELTVSNRDFNGYVHVIANRTVGENAITIDNNFISTVLFPSGVPPKEYEETQFVEIPVGTYTFNLQMTPLLLDPQLGVTASALLNYSTNPAYVFGEGVSVTANLTR